MPWGYVCGWPLKTGDMYGGSHYIMSAAADLTPQGRSILEAATKFGDGKTLPFPPCKRYYNPFSVDDNGNRTRLYACRLHHKLRTSRLKKEGGKWRGGEKKLDDFWKGVEHSREGCNPDKKSKADNGQNH